MGTERLGKPLRYLLSPYFQQGAPGVIRRSPHKPRLRLFLHLTGQEVSIDLNSFSLLMSECPEAADVHHDWATNPEMRPEQAPYSAVDFATLHHCGQLNLMRDTGERLVKHRVVEHQWHECWDGGRHVMAESTGEAVPKPVTPRFGDRSASGRQNDLPCLQRSVSMMNQEPGLRTRKMIDSRHAMVRMNDDTQRATSIEECGQDSSCLVGHRKELAGLFAFELDS